jgi:hypothetical protein
MGFPSCGAKQPQIAATGSAHWNESGVAFERAFRRVQILKVLHFYQTPLSTKCTNVRNLTSISAAEVAG